MAQFEAAFREEAADSVVRRERLRRQAVQRSRARRLERVRKRGTLHFTLLALAILATAVVVTVAMFQALAWLAG
jgi:hypothetical protein